MCLWCCWKDLDGQDFNWNLCGKIWIQSVGDVLIFKWFSAAENSNKFPKKQVLEGKISWGRVHTWANNTGHTSKKAKGRGLWGPCKVKLTQYRSKMVFHYFIGWAHMKYQLIKFHELVRKTIITIAWFIYLVKFLFGKKKISIFSATLHQFTIKKKAAC